jgi:hypothetical protein
MKYGLNKHEIATLKEAIDILDDIGRDHYANNIREILEEEVKENTSYNPTTALKYEVGKTTWAGGFVDG